MKQRPSEAQVDGSDSGEEESEDESSRRKAGAKAATSAASWTIKKIGLDAGGNPTYSQSTNIRSAVWNNRATETYS